MNTNYLKHTANNNDNDDDNDDDNHDDDNDDRIECFSRWLYVIFLILQNYLKFYFELGISFLCSDFLLLIIECECPVNKAQLIWN